MATIITSVLTSSVVMAEPNEINVANSANQLLPDEAKEHLVGVNQQHMGGSTVSLSKEDRTATAYNKVVELLANDPIYQKDVTLGKRIGFYKLGKELGSGNFSKVKLGVHILTKGKRTSLAPLKIAEPT